VYEEYDLRDSESGLVAKKSQQATGSITIAADLVRVMWEGEEWEEDVEEEETERRTLDLASIPAEDIRIENEEADAAGAGACAGAGGDSNVYWAETGSYNTSGEYYMREDGEFMEAEYVASDDNLDLDLAAAKDQSIPEVEVKEGSKDTKDKMDEDADGAEGEEEGKETEKGQAEDALSGTAPNFAEIGTLRESSESTSDADTQNNVPADEAVEKVRGEQKQVVAMYVNNMFCAAVDKISNVVHVLEKAVVLVKSSNNNNQQDSDSDISDDDDDDDDDDAPLPNLLH
jgi:hypothetical protein